GVPDHVRVFGQGDAVSFGLGLQGVEQTELDLGGMFRKNCEIDPGPIPGCPQGIRPPRPYSHNWISSEPSHLEPRSPLTGTKLSKIGARPPRSRDRALSSKAYVKPALPPSDRPLAEGFLPKRSP